MTGIHDLLRDLTEFEQTSESIGYDLRLDLSEIILRHLDGKKWTQSQLAKAMGVKPPFLTRILHASTNCTFETAGKILFALGVKAKLSEIEAGNVVELHVEAISGPAGFVGKKGTTYGFNKNEFKSKITTISGGSVYAKTA